MNTEAMGICHLKKGMCTENVKNACSHTMLSGLQQQLLSSSAYPGEQSGSRDVRASILHHSLWLGHVFGWRIPCCAGALRSLATQARWKEKLCRSNVNNTVLEERVEEQCVSCLTQDSVRRVCPHHPANPLWLFVVYIHLIRDPGLVCI